MKKMIIMSLLMKVFSADLFPAQTNIKGLIFGSYNFYSSKYRKNALRADSYNTFDIGRIYLTALNKHGEDYISKLTIEGNTLSSGNNVFLKLAYIQYRPKENKISISFGLVPSIWVGQEENLWKNIFVEYTQMHYLKIINPSDKGVSLNYNIKKLNSNVDIMLSNGEGYKNTETSKNKNIELKLSNSYKKINTSVYYASNIGNKEKDRIAFLLNFPINHRISFSASLFRYIDYSTTTANIEGSGNSIYLNIDLSKTYSCFLRWDRFDRDSAKTQDINDYFILGSLKKLTDEIMLSIAYKTSIPQKESLADKREDVIQSSFNVKF